MRDPAAWSWEAKWDGWRALVYMDERGLRVRTRPGRNVSASLPELSGLVDALGARSAILDGELVACPDSVPDFHSLAPRMAHTGRMARWAATQVPVGAVSDLPLVEPVGGDDAAASEEGLPVRVLVATVSARALIILAPTVGSFGRGLRRLRPLAITPELGRS